MHRHSGLTLLELIVVIFLVSLMAALVMPSFYRPATGGLKSDARKTASLLRYLNDSSIYTKQNFSLTFDLREGLLSWKGPEGEKRERIRTLADLTLPSQGEVREGQVTVFFGPMGAGEAVGVGLRDDDRRMQVVLNPISGRVEIKGEP